MRRIFSITFNITILLLSSLSAQALHLFMFGDTKDTRLGPHVMYNLHAFEQSFFSIAKASKYKFYKIILTTFDNSLTKQHILQAIERHPIAKNDIIVIYYGGHGARNHISPTIWPGASIYNEETGDKYVELVEILKMLILKKEALCLAIFDCCNALYPVTQAKSPTFQPVEYKAEDIVYGCKKLFSNSYGIIIASAASPKEVSYGGVFPRFFLVNLFQELKSPTPSWSNIFEKTKHQCIIETSEYKLSDNIKNYFNLPYTFQTLQYRTFLYKNRKSRKVYLNHIYHDCATNPPQLNNN